VLHHTLTEALLACGVPQLDLERGKGEQLAVTYLFFKCYRRMQGSCLNEQHRQVLCEWWSVGLVHESFSKMTYSVQQSSIRGLLWQLGTSLGKNKLLHQCIATLTSLTLNLISLSCYCLSNCIIFDAWISKDYTFSTWSNVILHNLLHAFCGMIDSL